MLRVLRYHRGIGWRGIFIFVSISVFGVERTKNFFVWESMQNILPFIAIMFVLVEMLLELSIMGRVV